LIILNELEKGTVKTKNILHRVATKNRSPINRQVTEFLPKDDVMTERESIDDKQNATIPIGMSPSSSVGNF
jgi:hypothetical protein